MINVIKCCPMCAAITTIEVDELAYRRWKNGVLIQDAMPDKSPSERESLISGLCIKCQTELFTEE